MPFLSILSLIMGCGAAVSVAPAAVDLSKVVVLCKVVSCAAGDCGHLL